MIQIGAFFLPAVPLLLLLAFLLLGRYPGHEAIVRLSERIAARGRRRGTGSRLSPTPAAADPSGQRRPLLAFALSGRAPPARLST